MTIWSSEKHLCENNWLLATSRLSKLSPKYIQKQISHSTEWIQLKPHAEKNTKARFIKTNTSIQYKQVSCRFLDLIYLPSAKNTQKYAIKYTTHIKYCGMAIKDM